MFIYFNDQAAVLNMFHTNVKETLKGKNTFYIEYYVDYSDGI